MKLEAHTDLPSLVPELSQQMRELGEAHTPDLPCEVICEVRMVFKSKVSKEGVRRLLKDADANMWGFDVSCHEGEEAGG